MNQERCTDREPFMYLTTYKAQVGPGVFESPCSQEARDPGKPRVRAEDSA